jgi:hypothetical protein
MNALITRTFKNASVTVEGFSKNDAKKALESKGLSVKVEKLTRIEAKNVYSVVFINLNTGNRISRVVGIKALIEAKVALRADSAKEVEFEYVSGVPNEDAVVGTTTTGHEVSIDFSGHTVSCSCKDHGRIKIYSVGLCKHSLSFAKSTLGITSLHQFADYVRLASV